MSSGEGSAAKPLGGEEVKVTASEKATPVPAGRVEQAVAPSLIDSFKNNPKEAMRRLADPNIFVAAIDNDGPKVKTVPAAELATENGVPVSDRFKPEEDTDTLEKPKTEEELQKDLDDARLDYGRQIYGVKGWIKSDLGFKKVVEARERYTQALLKFKDEKFAQLEARLKPENDDKSLQEVDKATGKTKEDMLIEDTMKLFSTDEALNLEAVKDQVRQERFTSGSVTERTKAATMKVLDKYRQVQSKLAGVIGNRFVDKDSHWAKRLAAMGAGSMASGMAIGIGTGGLSYLPVRVMGGLSSAVFFDKGLNSLVDYVGGKSGLKKQAEAKESFKDESGHTDIGKFNKWAEDQIQGQARSKAERQLRTGAIAVTAVAGAVGVSLLSRTAAEHGGQWFASWAENTSSGRAAMQALQTAGESRAGQDLAEVSHVIADSVRSVKHALADTRVGRDVTEVATAVGDAKNAVVGAVKDVTSGVASFAQETILPKPAFGDGLPDGVPADLPASDGGEATLAGQAAEAEHATVVAETQAREATLAGQATEAEHATVVADAENARLAREATLAGQAAEAEHATVVAETQAREATLAGQAAEAEHATVVAGDKIYTFEPPPARPPDESVSDFEPHPKPSAELGDVDLGGESLVLPETDIDKFSDELSSSIDRRTDSAGAGMPAEASPAEPQPDKTIPPEPVQQPVTEFTAGKGVHNAWNAYKQLGESLGLKDEELDNFAGNMLEHVKSSPDELKYFSYVDRNGVTHYSVDNFKDGQAIPVNKEALDSALKRAHELTSGNRANIARNNAILAEENRARPLGTSQEYKDALDKHLSPRTEGASGSHDSSGGTAAKGVGNADEAVRRLNTLGTPESAKAFYANLDDAEKKIIDARVLQAAQGLVRGTFDGTDMTADQRNEFISSHLVGTDAKDIIAGKFDPNSADAKFANRLAVYQYRGRINFQSAGLALPGESAEEYLRKLYVMGKMQGVNMDAPILRPEPIAGQHAVVQTQELPPARAQAAPAETPPTAQAAAEAAAARPASPEPAQSPAPEARPAQSSRIGADFDRLSPEDQASIRRDAASTFRNTFRSTLPPDIDTDEEALAFYKTLAAADARTTYGTNKAFQEYVDMVKSKIGSTGEPPPGMSVKDYFIMAKNKQFTFN